MHRDHYTALVEAERKAVALFDEVVDRNMIRAGLTERELNTQIFNLASEKYGIEKYWHKRIIRSGKNTLLPYYENPPNLVIQEEDILFVDFGPIFESWEADIGRTYVLGGDPDRHRLADDIVDSWLAGHAYFQAHQDCTGAELFHFIRAEARDKGWKMTAEMSGHIIGHFPHERLEKEDKSNYIHPDNSLPIRSKNLMGEDKQWILEVHFVHPAGLYGGFYEQMLTVEHPTGHS